MAKTTKDKIDKLNKVLADQFTLVRARQIDNLFPPAYLEKLLELEKLLSDVYGISGKSKAITLGVSYLIEEILNSDEFKARENEKAAKAEKDGETA